MPHVDQTGLHERSLPLGAMVSPETNFKQRVKLSGNNYKLRMETMNFNEKYHISEDPVKSIRKESKFSWNENRSETQKKPLRL